MGVLHVPLAAQMESGLPEGLHISICDNFHTDTHELRGTARVYSCFSHMEELLHIETCAP